MDRRTISIYDAIRRMSEISATGGTFSMKFRKWNRDTRNGGGLASIKAARIRPKTSDEDISHASYKIFFTDTETGRALNCWQPLLVEFNGIRTELT